jgi:hypothetical protein
VVRIASIHFAVNRKATRALGLTLPAILLAQATEIMDGIGPADQDADALALAQQASVQDEGRPDVRDVGRGAVIWSCSSRLGG